MGERPQDAATLKKRVHQMMTRQLLSINSDVSITEAAALMIDQRVSCLPVIDTGHKLVGIITTRDLIRWLIERHTESSTPCP
jgi:acetoin utilization protein AcuB